MKLRFGTMVCFALWSVPVDASEVETAGPATITPLNTFAHYNTTGATIGGFLYVYHQGAGDIADNSCPSGDKIIAYRAPITNGVPGAFARVGRISPCVPAPVCFADAGCPTLSCSPFPRASYGPGQIFQATINGVTRWHLLADASETCHFHNVWHGESVDGINWSWSVPTISAAQTETVQEAAGQIGGDIISHTIVANPAAAPFLHADNFSPLNPILLSANASVNNAQWWGYGNIVGGVAGYLIDWSTGSPAVKLLTSTAPWTYTPAPGGNMTGLNPVNLAPGANVKTLLLEPSSGQYQLWGGTSDGTYGAAVDCNTSTSLTCNFPGGCATGDGSLVPNHGTGRPFWLNTGAKGDVASCAGCIGNGISWWPVTSTSFGGANPLRSQVRSMPSGYEVARGFPFRWNSPTGNRYLFSSTNDNHICNEFLFSGFFKMYVAQTTLTSLSDSCSPSSNTLCLQNGRFEVKVDFTNNGVTQPAQTRTFSTASGFFTFFDAANPEVGVKIVDGRAVNGKWWVFHGALSSLAYTIRITDTVAHVLRTFSHPASTGTSLCGGSDVGAFSSVATAPATATATAGNAMLEFPAAVAAAAKPGVALSCASSSTRLCLFGGRFQVDVKRAGTSQGAFSLSDSSGVFWFFDPASAEVPVKVIDGRALNGKFWVFFGSLTDQAYQVVVTDTATGVSKTYTPPAAMCGTADTSAF